MLICLGIINNIDTSTPLDHNPILATIEKLTSLLVGYLVIRLGYLLIKSGAKGDFKFSADYKGVKGGLISSSPGLLFVLMGAAIMIYALSVNNPFTYSKTVKSGSQNTDSVYTPPQGHKVDSIP